MARKQIAALLATGAATAERERDELFSKSTSAGADAQDSQGRNVHHDARMARPSFPTVRRTNRYTHQYDPRVTRGTHPGVHAVPTGSGRELRRELERQRRRGGGSR